MTTETMPTSLDGWAQYILQWCERKGWNENLVFEKMLLNLHSEITEAWEEVRNGHGIDETYTSGASFVNDQTGEAPTRKKPEGVPVEIIDLLIRLLHICAWRGWNVQQLLEWKMRYNESRPYRHGGKTA